MPFLHLYVTCYEAFMHQFSNSTVGSELMQPWCSYMLSFTKKFVSGPWRKTSKSDWHSVPPGMKLLTVSAISMIHFKILGMLGTVLLSVVTYPYKTEIKTENELSGLKRLKIPHVLCGGDSGKQAPLPLTACCIPCPFPGWRIGFAKLAHAKGHVSLWAVCLCATSTEYKRRTGPGFVVWLVWRLIAARPPLWPQWDLADSSWSALYICFGNDKK